MPELGVAALHCIVTGRVQGVGFRAFVRSEATALGLAGWVRNREDRRSVELLAVGAEEDLTRFRERVSKGPPGAVVDRISCEWVEPDLALRTFEIRR